MKTLHEIMLDLLENPRKFYPDSAIRDQSARFAYIRERSESPIECSLGLSLIDSWKFVIVAHEDIEFPLSKYEIATVMQLPVANHRIDIGLFFRTLNGEPIKVAIECDGKQFHEGPENERRDAARDGRLRDAGFRVWRYPGWLLHHHAYVAANEIQDAANDLIMGRKPILTFTRQRENRPPTIDEMTRAYWAYTDGVPWPRRMGKSPRDRGWGDIDHLHEWANYEGRDEFPGLWGEAQEQAA